MKRLLAALLAAALLLAACALGENGAEEDPAKAVFENLAYIYDASLYYLDRYLGTWGALMDVSEKDDNATWVYHNVAAPNINVGAQTITFALDHGLGIDDTRGSEEIYENIFMPFRDRIGRGLENFKKACIAFNLAVNWDSAVPDLLEAQKAAIRALMRDAPDYAGLEGLKDFYKSASVLVDYVTNSNDNYLNATQRASDFKETRRQIKADFEFDFDWPEFKTPHITVDPTYTSLLTGYRDAKKAKEEAERQRAEKEAMAVRYVSAFSEGIARISRKDKMGCIDAEGNIVVECEWDVIGTCSDGMMAAYNGPYNADVYGTRSPDYDSGSGRTGYINTSGGLVIPCQYESNNAFREGLCLVKRNGKYGFIDKQGNEVIPCSYDFAYSFYRGRACVFEGTLKKNWKSPDKGKYGYIDAAGQLVVPMQYEDASWNFNDEGLACVKIKGKYGAIDVDGNVVIQPRYDSSFYFYDGLARVAEGKKSFFIDREGNTVLELSSEVTSVWSFSDGLAAFKTQKGYGYIDESGKVVIPDQYWFAGSCYKGVMIVAHEDKKHGVIDKQGNTVIPLEWDEISWLGEDYLKVCTVNQHKVNGTGYEYLFGVYDTQGNELFPCEYEAINYGDGILTMTKDGILSIHSMGKE